MEDPPEKDHVHDIDPAVAAAGDEIYADDCVFYDGIGTNIYRGRDEIVRVAGVIRATHPDFRYQTLADPEEAGNGGRVRWVSGRAWSGAGVCRD